MRRSRSHRLHWAVLAFVPALWTTVPVARAQGLSDSGGEDSVDLERAVGAVISLLGKITETTQDGLVKFFETVDLLDAEREIDRLAGSPWELHDSTTYKLSLLPYDIAYPIYRQLVNQMTRQDNLRGRRIHRVSPTGVDAATLRLEFLAGGDLSGQVRHSLLSYFNAREMIDLVFFVLAQQPFFPETNEGWAHLRRRLADTSLMIAAGVVGAGAFFNAGALGQAGRIIRSKDRRFELGWYGAFRRLGFSWQPALRAGLTLKVPGLEAAAGWAEQINPGQTSAHRALEFALREGWLTQAARAQGWDAFFEGALRRIVAKEELYEGEMTTGRVGFFFKRDEIRWLPHIHFRGSVELESDLVTDVRYANGLGLQHEPSGITAALQISRIRSLLGDSGPRDTRVGLFVAGAVDSPLQGYVDALNLQAQAAQERWLEFVGQQKAQFDAEKRLQAQSISAPGPPMAAGVEQDAENALRQMRLANEKAEQALVQNAQILARYVETRRLTYTLLRRDKAADGLHGPLPAKILTGTIAAIVKAREELFQRLQNVPKIETRLRERIFEVRTLMRVLDKDPAHAARQHRYAKELVDLQNAMRAHSRQTLEALKPFFQLSDALVRIHDAWGTDGAPERPAPLTASLTREIRQLHIRVPPLG